MLRISQYRSLRGGGVRGYQGVLGGFKVNWLNSAAVPSDRDLFLSSPAVKNYLCCKELLVDKGKEKFLIIGGALYHQPPDGPEKGLVMPESPKQSQLD